MFGVEERGGSLGHTKASVTTLQRPQDDTNGPCLKNTGISSPDFA